MCFFCSVENNIKAVLGEFIYHVTYSDAAPNFLGGRISVPVKIHSAGTYVQVVACSVCDC